jgi:phage-related protein
VLVRPITFLGDSLEAVRAFPVTARREAGFQLDRVQRGLLPENWKPLKTVGPGVNEIRVRDEAGAFRVLYVASLPEALYVLHAFQKKTQKTAKGDLELARVRLKTLRKER